MTNDQLNQLFQSAQRTPIETTPEQVAGWVSIAAASTTGVLGVAGKLKLFIAKKSLIMMASTIGIIGIGVVSVFVSPEQKEEAPVVTPVEQTISVHVDEPEAEPEATPVEIIAVTPTEVVPEEVPEVAEPGIIFIKPPSVAVIRVPEIRAVAPQIQKPPHPYTTQVAQGKDSTLEGNGNVTRQSREVQPFSVLSISGVFNVLIKQGDREEVIVETDENLQDVISVKNDGERLIIGTKKCNLKKATKQNILITVKDISKIEHSAIGDLKFDGTVTLDKLICKLSGVGDIKLDLDCKGLNLNYSGVGDIELKGKAGKSKINISGVGDLKANDFQAENLELTQSGVGDSKVNASKSLTVRLSGVGSVKYTGSPEQKHISSSGIGKVTGS